MYSSASCRMNQKQNTKKESMNYLLIELDQVKFEKNWLLVETHTLRKWIIKGQGSRPKPALLCS